MFFMSLSKRKTCLLFFYLLFVVFAPARATISEKNDRMAEAIDRVLKEAYPSGAPGAAVIVVRDGKTILRKGYGLANMELSVAVAAGMVFRLGSITKQFTAMAILMLADKGKLSLDDEITRFFPDYPTGGKKITVMHLLTHTYANGLSKSL